MDELVPGIIPDGITFGSKVARIPPVASQLLHCGKIIGLVSGKNYAWVQRGQPIAKFILYVSKKDRREVYIPAPVSGMLLYTSYEFGDVEIDGVGQRMVILLPDDEPPAEGGDYMFSRLCQTCWDFRAPFLVESTHVTSAGMPEESLRSILDEQLTYSCKYASAMPEYNDYFEEARSRHPALRPFLKHLL